VDIPQPWDVWYPAILIMSIPNTYEVELFPLLPIEIRIRSPRLNNPLSALLSSLGTIQPIDAGIESDIGP
jgi:hypothetical protein